MPQPSSSPALLVLRITLRFWEEDPRVELAFIRGAETAGDDSRIWRVQTASLGIPTSLEPHTNPVLDLPLQVTAGLQANLAKEPKTLPLWLRFAKPHGYLGVLPWESVLTQALGRPVLRLPDLLDRPRENHEVLEVAVCFDPGPDAPAPKVVEQINWLSDAIVLGSPRPQTRVNLFTTAAWFDRLRASSVASRVRLHDPAKAPTCSEAFKRTSRAVQEHAAGGQGPESGRPPLESPWSIWISQSLNKRSLDAVHFICRSIVTDSGPALMASSSPSPRETLASSSYTDATLLAALMTRTGAWAALFSAPPDGTSGVTLALMADALAHTRPASVLYHPLSRPEHVFALRLAYSFLFARAPTAVPPLAEGFLYCQPNSVAAYAALPVSPVLTASRQNAALLERASGLTDRLYAAVTPYVPLIKNHELEQPPNWATAVQRHIETVALEELRRNSPDVLLSTPESARAQIDPNANPPTGGIVNDTLADIQKVVGDYLQKSR
jgi:hypothetical protein